MEARKMDPMFTGDSIVGNHVQVVAGKIMADISIVASDESAELSRRLCKPGLATAVAFETNKESGIIW